MQFQVPSFPDDGPSSLIRCLATPTTIRMHAVHVSWRPAGCCAALGDWPRATRALVQWEALDGCPGPSCDVFCNLVLISLYLNRGIFGAEVFFGEVCV